MQTPLDLTGPFQPRLQNFLPGENENALAALNTLGKPPACIYLYGESAAGKTHLLRGCQAQFEPQSQYFDLANPDSIKVLRDWQPAGIVLLDHLHAALSKPQPESHSEEILFHFINRVQQNLASLVIAGRQAPASLPVQLPDLASRLKQFAAFKISRLPDAQLQAFCESFLARANISFPAPLIAYFLSRAPRKQSLMVQLLQELVVAVENQGKLTRPLIREVILRHSRD